MVIIMRKQVKSLKYFIMTVCVLLSAASFGKPVMAQRLSQINFACYATVIEVIDGCAVRVSVFNTGETGLVKLIGLETAGNDEAFRYLSEKLLGTVVQLLPDKNISPSSGGMWSLLHVVCLQDNRNVSETMLSLGYGKVSANHKDAENYSKLIGFQNDAAKNKLGIWFSPEPDAVVDADDGNYDDEYDEYTGNKININTATERQMQNFFEEIPLQVIRNIVLYRANNFFSNVRELKFVNGFTKEHYDIYAKMISVITNISKASEYELSTLISFGPNDIYNIIEFREKYGFRSVTDLSYYMLVRQEVYLWNLPYITINSVNEFDRPVPSTQLDRKSTRLNSSH